jgi:hypothetical protein
MKRLLVIALLAILCGCAVHPLDYQETVILRNYWSDSRLPLTREIATSPYEGEGYEAYLPYTIIVKNREIFIFDMATPTFVKIDESGNLLATYTLDSDKCRAFAVSDDGKVYLRCLVFEKGRGKDFLFEYDLNTRSSKQLFALDGVADLFYDDETHAFYRFGSLNRELEIYTQCGKSKVIPIGEMLLEKNGHYYDYENVIHRNIVYSPIDHIHAENGSYMNGISKYDLKKNRIDCIMAKGRDFGFVILGIDSNETIYSATDWEPTHILVHDAKGDFLAEITPDYSKYGSAERGAGSVFHHPPFISEEGGIYLLVLRREGIFVIKYSAVTD